MAQAPLQMRPSHQHPLSNPFHPLHLWITPKKIDNSPILKYPTPMRQIIQNFKTGETILETIPVPQVKSGHVLIKTHRSLVSLGTERMLVEFGQSNLLQKAKQQPEKVKQVLNKIKTDGLQPTLEAVNRKLDTPIPLGYSMAGEVIAVGNDVTEFKIGDRVISNGGHAEIVSAPVNLVAKIPDSVPFDEAAFTVISSIGLQGIRLADPKLGESVVVIGMGLIGLITAQLLVASGCNVIGTDIDPEKLKLAESFGVTTINPTTRNPVQSVLELTNQTGADSVIITASSKSNDIIRESAEMSRKRGKIILVGVVGLDIDRSTLYQKELTFQVSCSYGPGRYDETYEQKGIDYPLPFVRWTEKRNFEAILTALEKKQLKVNDLITERVRLDNFHTIYQDIASSKSIASIIEYETDTDFQIKPQDSVIQLEKNYQPSKGKMAIIGAGNFTQASILPALKKAKLDISSSVKYIVSSEGLSSTALARKFKIPFSSTDFNKVLEDPEVNSVIITTRHNLHAPMSIQALLAGKHVFVEKPLALSPEELEAIKEAKEKSGKSITVGFNRRFSPHTLKIKSLLGGTPGPMHITATMNAGNIPKEHWTQNPEIGGGRIIGEACHYFDLLIHLTGSQIKSVCMNALGENPDATTDTASILVKFKNGSSGVINYLANGNSAYSKERLELFYENKNIIMDNFRTTSAFGFSKTKLLNSSGIILKTQQDKGHKEQFAKFAAFQNKGGTPLIPFSEIENSTKATFASLRSLLEKSWVDV
jgi:predicted dehydrogenase/threonine dehydrogenase-like Zn-dependent dehydrogenase